MITRHDMKTVKLQKWQTQDDNTIHKLEHNETENIKICK